MGVKKVVTCPNCGYIHNFINPDWQSSSFYCSHCHSNFSERPGR